MEGQVIEIVTAFLHGVVRALQTGDGLGGGGFHHGLFVMMAAENQRGHFFEVFIFAIASEQEAAHPIAHELIMAVRIGLERFLRVGEFGLAAFLDEMPLKLREQLVRFLTDSPVLAVCNFVK